MLLRPCFVSLTPYIYGSQCSFESALPSRLFINQLNKILTHDHYNKSHHFNFLKIIHWDFIYHLVHPSSCPGNKYLLFSFSPTTELESYFQNTTKPGKAPFDSHNCHCSITTGQGHNGSSYKKHQTAWTPPSSNQVKPQYFTQGHRSGSSMEAEQDARNREIGHTCIFLSPVSYSFFCSRHEVCIRLNHFF